MRRALLLIVLMLALLASVAVGTGIFSEQVPGQLVDAYGMQNGDTVTVSTANERLILRYNSLEDRFVEESIRLPHRTTPDHWRTEICGGYVQVWVSWESEFLDVWQFTWSLPVEIERAWLPVVCR